MKTTLVSKENNEAKFAMEFTAEEFDAAVDAAYKKSRGEFRINGGRPGEITMRLRELLTGIQHGTVEDTHHWNHTLIPAR